MTIQEKAKKMVANAQLITLASIDENGYPRPAVLSKLGVSGNSIFVSTGASSAKTAHFIANPKAGVSIVDNHNSIIFTGKVDIVTDKEVKKSLWSDWMQEHFTGGVDDPEYTVLRFTPETATYWIDSEFVKEAL